MCETNSRRAQTRNTNNKQRTIQTINYNGEMVNSGLNVFPSLVSSSGRAAIGQNRGSPALSALCAVRCALFGVLVSVNLI